MNSPLASPRATREVLAAHGLSTRKSLGQHLLVDDNVVGRILDLADLRGDEVVFEIGPGIGTLTVALCTRCAALVAVERDPQLVALLGDTADSCERLELICDDAVKVPVERIAEPFGPPDLIVANLPYAVAATVVLRFFQEMPRLSSAVVMVQAEVADRMTAVPGTKDYGAYSVKLQLLVRAAGRFAVSSSCFLPAPRVESSVIRLDREDRGLSAELVQAASLVADAAFSQRRKTVRNSLRARLAGESEAADTLLSSAGIDGSRRAETLSVEEYVTLGEISHKLALLP